MLWERNSSGDFDGILRHPGASSVHHFREFLMGQFAAILKAYSSKEGLSG